MIEIVPDPVGGGIGIHVYTTPVALRSQPITLVMLYWAITEGECNMHPTTNAYDWIEVGGEAYLPRYIEDTELQPNECITVRTVTTLADNTILEDVVHLWGSEGPPVIPEITAMTITLVGVGTTGYEMAIETVNIEPDYQFFVRSQAGTPECTQPDIIAEDSSANGTRMAAELKADGVTLFGVNPNENFTMTLIIADALGEILTYRSICQNYPPD